VLTRIAQALAEREVPISAAYAAVSEYEEGVNKTCRQNGVRPPPFSSFIERKFPRIPRASALPPQ
jgi:hypothetical protein